MPTIPDRKTYDSLAALNFSGARELLKSPLHFQSYLNKPREETKALRLGSLTHALVLEPHSVEQRFAVAPECDRRTKDGKAIYEAFVAGAAGKTVVSAEENDLAVNVSKSMASACESLGVSFLFTEAMFTVEYNGVRLKSAIDAIGDDGYLYDLKTAECASARGFLQSVRSYSYNLQAHFYRLVYELETGNRARGFRFIVAEKSEPWAWAIYELGPEFMTFATMEFEEAVQKYKSCRELDSWPGYPTEVQVLDLNAKPTASTPINFA